MTRTILLLLWLLLAGFYGFLFLHTSAGPYLNNQWKPHRWARGQKPSAERIAAYKKCLAAPNDDGNTYHFCVNPEMPPIITIGSASGETAEFDICLEHGELRRIQ